MIYEVINPSDPVTLEHDDVEVVKAACLMLGRGAYSLEDEHGVEVMPILMFEDDLSVGLRDILASKRMEVAVCLRGAICCETDERKALLVATGGDPDRIAAYNDERRSSTNDICGRARSLAVGMVGGWGEEPKGSDE